MRRVLIGLIIYGGLCTGLGYLIAPRGAKHDHDPSPLHTVTNPPNVTLATYERQLADWENVQAKDRPFNLFYGLLASIQPEEERGFLIHLAGLIGKGRLSEEEARIACEWVARRGLAVSLPWLEGLSANAVKHYDIASILFSKIVAENPSAAAEIMQSPIFTKYPLSAAIYEGLLTSDPMKAEDLLQKTFSNLDDRGRMIQVAEMQSKKLRLSLLDNGIEGALSVVTEGLPSSHSVGSPIEGRVSGGINSSLINQFFRTLTNVDPIPASVILNSLQDTKWFGTDTLETTVALSRLAVMDGTLAMNAARKATSEDQNNLTVITSTFKAWAQKDESGALNYLNTTPLPELQQLNLLNILNETTKNDIIKQETAQILQSKGWVLESSPDN